MQSLDFVKFIQGYRNPFLDSFFEFLNFFDTLGFFVILVSVIWIWFGWKIGLKIFYILFLSNFAINSLKELFAMPRPYQIDSSLGLIQTSGGSFGFPSGAATTVILLSGILITEWKSRWRWVVAFIYISLISISRIYLGMHFPIDILGGWILGFLFWLIYAYIFPLIEKRLEKLRPITLLALSQIVPLLLLFWRHSASAIAFSCVAMGMGISIFIWKKD